MKIESNYKILNSDIQNFSHQNNKNFEQKNLISPPYQVELSKPAKKIISSSSGEENISTIKNFVASDVSEIKENFRQEMIQGINSRIGEVLKPYENFEDAFENLYAKETTGWWSIFDEKNLKINTGPKISGVQGAFGVLANSLNNYLDQFGKDDEYFDTLLQNLEKIDENNGDEIVGQIKNMISTVKSGNFIDIHSSKFEKDVSNSISAVYSKIEIVGQKQTKNQDKKPEIEEKNLSDFELEMQKTNETEQILDKFLGKESKNNFKIAWKRKIVLQDEFNHNDITLNETLKNDKLSDALLKLSSKYRNVIYLYYYEGYKIDEISEILNLKQSNIKSLLSRGRKKLKEYMEDTKDEK